MSITLKVELSEIDKSALLDGIASFLSRFADAGLPVKIQSPVKGAHSRHVLPKFTRTYEISDNAFLSNICFT